MSDTGRPYFAFETELTPVPTTPTHCRACGVVELEPLRRYGGLCKACVRSRSKAAPADQQLRCRMKVVRQLYRQRVGHRERYVEVRCECGRRRVLKWSNWCLHPPLSCNRCRLRGIERYGFAPEFARVPQRPRGKMRGRARARVR